ncbi:MAG: hypothetical protein DMG97_07790 [Acidobacteria bacterium]|nr:MAG: hypothetical protein DMG98_22595 [Acidobacteriota bacterium]PYV74806.1 MAG: hypothetical protein DMG97_07790 [Acidobacteriota bacterium]
MELKTILSKFIYRIEPKPGAGFIATCKDSTAPAIEGATRQEVQRKIQESIAANLGTQFPALQSALAGNDVKLHYHIEAKPGGGFVIHHGDPNSFGPEHAPIEGSTREHMENLIESKIFSAIMDRLPPELHQQVADKLNSGGLDIDVNRTISVSSRGSPFTPVIGKSSAPALDQNLPSALGTTDPTSSGTNSPIIRYDGNSPVQYEKSSSGALIRFLLALAIVAAMIYVFLHRH